MEWSKGWTPADGDCLPSTSVLVHGVGSIEEVSGDPRYINFAIWESKCNENKFPFLNS
jgi:hypothetical protein